MRKYLSILAVLAALGTGSANAQQRQAVLQRVDIPGSDFYLVVATAEPKAPVGRDSGGLADPSVFSLMGGELVHAYDGTMQGMFPALAPLLSPVLQLHVEGIEAKMPMPIAVYLVPKDERLGPPMQ